MGAYENSFLRFVHYCYLTSKSLLPIKKKFFSQVERPWDGRWRSAFCERESSVPSQHPCKKLAVVMLTCKFSTGDWRHMDSPPHPQVRVPVHDLIKKYVAYFTANWELTGSVGGKKKASYALNELGNRCMFYV